jgi:hypothetical protein
MYSNAFRYPSVWTESWDSYQIHKQELMKNIVWYMENYESRVDVVQANTTTLTQDFFSATGLLKNIK